MIYYVSVNGSDKADGSKATTQGDGSIVLTAPGRVRKFKEHKRTVPLCSCVFSND